MIESLELTVVSIPVLVIFLHLSSPLVKTISCKPSVTSDMVTVLEGNLTMVTHRALSESHSMGGAMSGEPDERVLHGWLNAARGTESYVRVTNLIELIRQSEEGTRKALVAGAYHTHGGESPKVKRDKRKLARAASQPYAELQRSLERYVFRIRLTGTIQGAWILNFHRSALKGEFGWEAEFTRQAPPGATVISSPTYTVSEGDAVLAVLRLAQRGLLNRVRLCAHCAQTWMYANKSHYKFCTQKCRESHFAHSDEYKKRKASNQRAYRDRLRKAERRGAHLR
jgi:hypothetical protein